MCRNVWRITTRTTTPTWMTRWINATGQSLMQTHTAPKDCLKVHARASSSCALPVPFVHDLCTLINKLALTFAFLLLESSAASFEELVVNFGDVALACSMIERSFSFLPLLHCETHRLIAFNQSGLAAMIIEIIRINVGIMEISSNIIMSMLIYQIHSFLLRSACVCFSFYWR